VFHAAVANDLNRISWPHCADSPNFSRERQTMWGITKYRVKSRSRRYTPPAQGPVKFHMGTSENHN